MRGIDLISFYLYIKKSWYTRKDTGSVFPPDIDLEVSCCKSFLTGSLLPPDMGQVSGCKSFLGGWFVICGVVCDVGCKLISSLGLVLKCGA